MASTLTTTEPSPEAMATAYDQAAAALYLRRVRLGVNVTLVLSSVFVLMAGQRVLPDYRCPVCLTSECESPRQRRRGA